MCVSFDGSFYDNRLVSRSAFSFRKQRNGWNSRLSMNENPRNPFRNCLFLTLLIQSLKRPRSTWPKTSGFNSKIFIQNDRVFSSLPKMRPKSEKLSVPTFSQHCCPWKTFTIGIELQILRKAMSWSNAWKVLLICLNRCSHPQKL